MANTVVLAEQYALGGLFGTGRGGQGHLPRGGLVPKGRSTRGRRGTVHSRRCVPGRATRRGTEWDRAVAWWRKATEQGDADAQCSLGGAYVDGVGVDQSHPGA
jgi:TPR repeat protein